MIGLTCNGVDINVSDGYTIWKFFSKKTQMLRTKFFVIRSFSDPVDTGRKLNVHKTFRRRPGFLLNVLCTFNLRSVSTGNST